MKALRPMRALLLTLAMMAVPAASFAGVFLSVGIAPPPLPVYAQPVCPGPNYIWTPGYWAYGDDGYYWVPGTWVMAPQTGMLWTPAYWGWGGSAFLFHAGYWGPHIGFYGGINYGYGYGGFGYEGGYWNHGAFAYNRTVNNIDVTNIHNTYNRTVVNNNTTRVSYNGGKGGLAVQPRPQELAAQREQHAQPTSAQVQHQTAASQSRMQLASVNHGTPAIAATPRPGAFNSSNAVHPSPGPQANARTANNSAQSRSAQPGGAQQNAQTAARSPQQQSRPLQQATQRPQAQQQNRQQQRQQLRQQRQQLRQQRQRQRQQQRQAQRRQPGGHAQGGGGGPHGV